MPRLAPRPWVPTDSQIRETAAAAGAGSADIAARIDALARRNREIHERDCVNLNPATNVMNPRAEALLASGLGTRPSLGHPFDKYEMGLEAIEEIEVLAAELCAAVFDADFAEIRVPSGAIANLYAFMAIAAPGDTILVPPGTVGGHVTHHRAGCAGLYHLDIHEVPAAQDGYTIDLAALAEMASRLRPRLITIGGSLNLHPHPVAEITAIARDAGARVLFDAAHQCGLIAGGVWPNPLDEGADLMTMSTYKSLGGPPSGLIVTRDASLAERLDGIAFPGMTANFDAAKSAALAIAMLDWRDHGPAYAQAMVDTAQALAGALAARGLPVFGATQSHQFALLAAEFGGGQAASKRLRQANLLACGIGLPAAPVAGDMNGLRMGTPELVRWGMGPDDMGVLAKFIDLALRGNDPAALAARVSDWRRGFDRMHFIHQS